MPGVVTVFFPMLTVSVSGSVSLWLPSPRTIHLMVYVPTASSEGTAEV